MKILKESLFESTKSNISVLKKYVVLGSPSVRPMYCGNLGIMRDPLKNLQNLLIYNGSVILPTLWTTIFRWMLVRHQTVNVVHE